MLRLVWVLLLAPCFLAAACTTEELAASRGYFRPCSDPADLCDDGDVCTADVCDTGAGMCVNAPIRLCCVADSDCTAPTSCFAVACDLTVNRCTRSPVPGCCHETADCFDGDDCTRDSCYVPTGECRWRPRSCFCRTDTNCDDANACTADTCDILLSRCVFSPVPGCCAADSDCTDGNACTTDACDVSTGSCLPPVPVSGCCNFDDECDDGDVCTANACDLSVHTCSFSPISNCCEVDGDCDDGLPCTTDACDTTANECRFTAVSGCCVVDGDCDDGDPCTTNTCQLGSCSSTPVSECCLTDGDCDDGRTCTTDRCISNACDNGVVAGCCETDEECDDSDPCTADSCLATTCSYRDVCLPDAGPPDAGPSDGGPLDGGLLDGTVILPDGAVADGAVADGGSPDGALPDGALPDGALPDGALPDGALPDGAVADAGPPDGAVVDGAVADAGLPDGSVVFPDAGLPDGSVVFPDAGPPDGGDVLPDGSLPDGALPDGALPDGALPDGAVSDGGGADAGGGDAGMDGGRRHTYELGGGACSAAGNPGAAGTSAAVLVFFALLGLGTLGRRRGVAALAVAVSAISMLWSAEARADGFLLDRYRAPMLPEDLLWAERAAVGGHNSPFVRLGLVFSDDPLVARDSETGSQHGVLIDHQLGIHLSAGVSVLDRLHVALVLPVYLQSTGSTEAASDEPLPRPDDTAVGDPGLDARFVILGADEVLELAAGATLTAPIGNTNALAAERTVSFAPRLIVGRRIPQIRAYTTLTVGALLTGSSSLGDLEPGSSLFWIVAAAFSVTDELSLSAEVAGSTTITHAFDSQHTPVEGMIGGQYRILEGLTASLGAGTGLTQGYGAPDVRLLGGVAYRFEPLATDEEDEEPTPAAEPVDSDGDGLLDPEDACPSEPEDIDGFEDADGCPDPDNDQDRILDPDDGCPLEPEDHDDFEDTDGCPDPDNDQDGVLDPEDGCPLEPEDMDGFEDGDGCPDPDNDQDGMLDGDDGCPNEPETVNGRDDEDGCPDLIRVDRATRQIRILEPVYFATNSHQIQSRSFPLLDEMAMIVTARPELGRVSIEGHTDDRGRDVYNQVLSERRTQSVRDYLVEHGVPAERVEAHGFGETRPIAPNNTPAGRAENRRVEFRLIDLPEYVPPPVTEE